MHAALLSCGRIQARATSFQLPRPHRCWGGSLQLPQIHAVGAALPLLLAGSAMCPPFLATVPTSTRGGPWDPSSPPSLRLRIPTSSGHGIHSIRKVKPVAVCAQDPLSAAADPQASSRGAAVP